MDLREVFAANLRRLRHTKGLSQDDLAYEAKISRGYLSQLEKGVFYASLKIVGKIANALTVKPAELLNSPTRWVAERKKPQDRIRFAHLTFAFNPSYGLCNPQRDVAGWPMVRTLDSPRHEALRVFLIERRTKAGLRQVDVAKRLRRSQSYVTYVETGQKLVDVVELMEWADAIGFDARDAIKRLYATPKR
ncbi:MAG: helix-turn-helix transcriptional regulator [Pseudolabrys sp.]